MSPRYRLRDLSGRVVTVTGATSGVGLATAQALATAGARVIMAVRNTGKGAAVARMITASHPEAEIAVRALDLADLDSVRSFAAGWTGRLDVLINNAGVMSTRRAETADGFELQFGTNHLGHFALTTLLLPAISDRVVTVSSDAHRWAELDLADPNWEHRRYRAFAAYGQSKLANLLFTLELDRRVRTGGRRALAVHPGWVRSHLGVSQRGRSWLAVSHALGAVFGQSAADGALCTLVAATQDLPGASYVGPDGLAGNRGTPTLLGRTGAAGDPVLAARLWELSTTLVG